MRHRLFLLGTLISLGVALGAQKKSSGVSTEMLTTPPPEDWLMYSRTYDAQRYSPLEFVNRRNVSQLKTAWTKEMPSGNHESIPIVYNGVMFMVQPGAAVWALNAATGDLIWEYKRDTTLPARTKTLAIYRDMVYYTAPDGFIEHKRALYLKDPSSPDPVERFLVFGKSGSVVYERDFRSYPLTELD